VPKFDWMVGVVAMTIAGYESMSLVGAVAESLSPRREPGIESSRLEPIRAMQPGVDVDGVSREIPGRRIRAPRGNPETQVLAPLIRDQDSQRFLRRYDLTAL